MTCLTCGATLESDETMCPVCAAPVATDASAATSRPTTSPPADRPALGAGAGAAGPGGSGAGPNRGAGGGTPGGAPPGPAAWSQPTHPSGLGSDVRGWGIAAHLIGLGGALLTVVTLGFLGPLVVWLLKRDEHPFIDHHAKESLNFQLTTLLALVVATLAAIPVFLLGFLTFGVLWLVAIIVVVAATVVWFVFPVIGAVKAANGEGYRYPVNIRFVR